MSSPVVDHGVIYMAALDQQTVTVLAVRVKGDVIWQQVYPNTTGGGMILKNDHLYAVLSNQQYRPSQLLDSDKTTGQIQHSLTFDSNMSYPTIADSGIYLGNGNGVITALAGFGGNKRWSTQLPGNRDEVSSTDIDGTMLYVATGRTIFGLNTTNGHIVWQNTVPGGPGRSHQLYQPAVVHDTLYAYANNDTVVYALDPRNGSIRWHYDNVGYSVAPPMVWGGVTYIPGLYNVSLVQESDGTPIKQLGTAIFDASSSALIAMP